MANTGHVLDAGQGTRPNALGAAVGVAVTIVLVAITTFVAMLLPSLAFIAGVPLVDVGSSHHDLTEVALTIRSSLADKYLNWSVVVISICGAVLWRLPRRSQGFYVRALLILAFLLASVGIISGVSFLELLALSASVGVPISEADQFYMLYPQVQFACTVSGFLFAVVAAIATVLREARLPEAQSDEGGQASGVVS